MTTKLKAMPTPKPLHLKQPCGCGLYLHGHSWEYVLKHSKGYEFVRCSIHAAASEMAEALRLIIVNAETAARYAGNEERSTTSKDTIRLQHAPHWPGIDMARAILTRIGEMT